MKISRSAAAALRDALRINRRLKKIAIIECEADKESVEMICAGVSENLGLEQLVCVGTELNGWPTLDGAPQPAEWKNGLLLALRKNDTLRRLVLPSLGHSACDGEF